MHPNRRFQLSDRDSIAALVRGLGFGTLFAATSQGPRAVHVPVMLDGDRLRFHISRGNAIHPALAAGATALFVANGPHAYLSPDDYGMEDRVPTWNYVAVELEGPVRALDEAGLIGLLDSLSDAQEARLAPKPAWNRNKMAVGRFEALTKAIAGFEMLVTDWRGTAKLDQDKPDAVRHRLADALATRGETEMAAAMRPEGSFE
ncbi:MAG: FMN-binding negative transcriptional regulator [Alphaproteobacteria bacterium]|nr:FMN-binding negative transcriptional regulator [Alphaproteobacteria bacterium]